MVIDQPSLAAIGNPIQTQRVFCCKISDCSLDYFFCFWQPIVLLEFRWVCPMALILWVISFYILWAMVTAHAFFTTLLFSIVKQWMVKHCVDHLAILLHPMFANCRWLSLVWNKVLHCVRQGTCMIILTISAHHLNSVGSVLSYPKFDGLSVEYYYPCISFIAFYNKAMLLNIVTWSSREP